MSQDDYLKALKANKKNTEDYYTKSFVKTEQQKFLEVLLEKENRNFTNIADIACGGGATSYHLNQKYPSAHFTLVDYNDDAISIAKKNIDKKNFSFLQDSIYELSSLKENAFDLVCCWQTLSWIEDPELALKKLIQITQPGGKLYLSSLFNINFDVDIYAKVIDYSKESGKESIPFNYNTYSALSINKWIGGLVKDFKIHEFVPNIDFNYNGKGIGTFTKMVEGKRIQISAGHLLNWGILEITK